MAQMYKVFFNERFVTLTDKLKAEEVNQYQLIHPYKNLSDLEEIKDYFENKPISNMAVLFDDVEYLKNKFFSFFKLISAAGGLVINIQDKYLMIFRRGKWDLPKGKAEKNESIAETALREVCEETGISDIELTDKICNTYHTYKIGQQPILKETYWYLMKSGKQEELIPQEKEDITEAKWVKGPEVDFLLQNSFGTIKDVFDNYRQLIL